MDASRRPIFLKPDELGRLRRAHPELLVHDELDLATSELFDIAYPAKKDSKTLQEVADFQKSVAKDDLASWGVWVYYPWANRLVHFPPQKELRMLRTSRNRNLVTSEEQAQLYDSTILIVGMSVGSNVAEALVSQGIGGKLILVDMDIIEPTNLNRIRSPYHQVGVHKVEAIAQRLWEIDPYLEIAGYHDGLTEANLPEILDEHQPAIVVDEMDELKMKIKLREAAKAHKLPVIMAADDGDNALIDIERYDNESDLELFAGRIPTAVLDKIKSEPIPRPALGLMIGKYFVGSDNIPLRMYQSLGEVGKTLPSWPQLGGAAALAGVTLAYICKKIILGQKLRSGRTLISLDEKLDLEQFEAAHAAELKGFQEKLDDAPV